MHDINPLVHQLYLRDLERSALAARSPGTGSRRSQRSAALGVAVAVAVALAAVFLGGQAAVIAAALS